MNEKNVSRLTGILKSEVETFAEKVQRWAATLPRKEQVMLQMLVAERELERMADAVVQQLYKVADAVNLEPEVWLQQIPISKETVIKEIDDHIAECGGPYASWYVGVAADQRKRLFANHNVHQQDDVWLWRACATSEDARGVSEHFVKDLGTRGSPGSGDEDKIFVYAYKISPNTKQ